MIRNEFNWKKVKLKMVIKCVNSSQLYTGLRYPDSSIPNPVIESNSVSGYQKYGYWVSRYSNTSPDFEPPVTEGLNIEAGMYTCRHDLISVSQCEFSTLNFKLSWVLVLSSNSNSNFFWVRVWYPNLKLKIISSFSSLSLVLA